MNRTRMIDASYLLLRLAAGLMYFQAGAMKTFGWYGGMPGAASGRAELLSQIGIGGVMEVLGGLAIMLGLLTRPVAFVLAGEMAVAYWQFHAPNGAWPLQNGGVAAALYCFVFLYMAARGGGAWSLDSWRGHRRASAA